MSRALLLSLVLVGLIAPAHIAAEPAARTSTVADRESVNLTVYNGGTALVHDRRRVTLDNGVNRIAWRDVSAQMDPTSALVESFGADPVRVLEQNYNFDLLNPDALLQKYVGHNVIVVHDPRFPGERETRETARLLSTNGGTILQYRNRIETQVQGHIVFPLATKNLSERPTLDLDMEAQRDGSQSLDLSYLTNGLSWRADYVGVLTPDEAAMNLTGLVTLSNTSGAAYPNARLQLVAGNVNVVQPPVGQALKTIARVSANVYSTAGVQQENYFEYHLYTFDRTTTIRDSQTKQLTLLSAHKIPVRKTLELRGADSYYRNAQADLGDRLPIGVYIAFDNKGGELGIPLPAGIVRLYKSDSHNTSQFLGSDQLDHTPKNETARLHLGDSFDVTARKRQTDFRFTGACTTDSSYEVNLGNAKNIPQDVLVVEPIPGEWNIVDENRRHTKSSSSTANWLVHLAPERHETLTYTAHVRWCY